ncbi:MAG: S41 family peptidase, partial [Minisyncoccia bacterium]
RNSPFYFINQKLEEKKLDPNLFWQVWTTVQIYYVKQPVSDLDLFYGSLHGIVGALKDPYSIFLDPKTAKSFKSEISGTFEGIGIEIGIKNNQLTVIAPLPDTPAARAGLLSGDKIFAIDGLSTAEMSIDQAASLIRGKRGTKVKLTIFRKGWHEPKDFEIIRDKIEIETVHWETKDNNIIYLKISHFNSDTFSDLKQAVKEILLRNPQKIILDLRNNPGGYLDEAVNSASLWLPNNLITYAKDAKGQVESFTSHGQGEFSNLKTVVLINFGSASGAEILAGALQDYQKATLVGEKTFGKGSVQKLIDLPGGSAIKITTAYWYTPNGRQINEIGIEPEIKVEMTEEDYNQNRDPQLDKAIELLK